jgi:hypothetical protein
MAKNSIGESISREARMVLRTTSTSSNSNAPVATAASIDSRPQFVQVSAGHVYSDDESDFIVMQCASGIPKPQISWTFNNQPLHESDRVFIYDNGTLVIHKPEDDDEGNYRCEVKNIHGTLSTVANYRINGKTLDTIFMKQHKISY